MISKQITIQRASGMETRPVAMLVQVASQFESSIHIESGNRKVNAKSIMGMMSLGVDTGEVVIVSAQGSDEEEAVRNIEKYLTSK